jgi:hypothetical protein
MAGGKDVQKHTEKRFETKENDEPYFIFVYRFGGDIYRKQRK